MANDGQVQGNLLKTVTTTTEQDDHGNVEKMTVESRAGGDVFTTETAHTYGNGVAINFQNAEHGFSSPTQLGRLSETVVTHSRSGAEPASRTSSFSYYDQGHRAGLLETEVVEPNNAALRITTRYDYDLFGNKVLVEQTATGEEPRTQRFYYESDGRFVDKEENRYGQILSQVKARNAYGQPTLVEEAGGTQAQFSYDAFGRQLLSYSSTGAHKISLMAAAGTQCPAGSAYQHIERSGEGAEAIACFDLLAREVRQAARAFDGGWNYVDIEYDNLGRVKHQSEPYKQGETVYWSTLSYDLIGRVIGTDLPGIQSMSSTGYDLAQTYAGFTTTTINPKGQRQVETINAAGEKVQSKDNLGNTLKFKYGAQGQLLQVINQGGGSRNLVTTMTYDLLGRKKSMSDPDKGKWHYVYNGYGELVRQADAKGEVVENDYDQLGRLIERRDRDASGSIAKTTQWTYNNLASKDAFGTPPTALREVVEYVADSTDPGFIKHYSYDTFGRPSEMATSFADGDNHFEKTTYDEYSRPFQIFDAGGDGSWENSAIRNHYNIHGHLEQVVDAELINLATAEQFYTVEAMDARGNVTRYRQGNGVTTEKTYDPATGRLLGQRATILGIGNIQELRYEWDDLGNLTWREDKSGGKDLRETFTYDALNRLTVSQVAGRVAQTVSYDDLGNITHKSDVGDYRYGSECDTGYGPHAVCETSDGVSYQYDPNGNMISDSSGRSLEYTTFDKPSAITKGGHKTEFKYGSERKRYLRVDTDKNGKITETRTIGNVEKITKKGVTEIKRYLPGGALITLSQGQGRESRYLHKDHLGSLDVITDGSGVIVEHFSFDAWGQRRNAMDWSALLGKALTDFGTSITTRGYTGHEMLDQVGLIHMNGRIYDPRLARFLQADPFVQAPAFSQSHNRYAYVWNNPLNSTDPSGYFKLRQFVGVIVAVVGGFICGAPCAQFGWQVIALGAVSGAAGAAANGGNILQGAVIGGLSAAAFGGVGEAFSGAPAGSFLGSGLTPGWFAGKVLAHGFVGGMMSAAQGGKFGHGFASAGVAQAFSGAINRIGKGSANYFSAGNRAARIIAAAAVGGTASELSGGKFANGAVTGAFSRAFNDELKHGKEEVANCSSSTGGSLVAYCTASMDGGKRFQYKGQVAKRCAYICTITVKDALTVETNNGTFLFDQKLKVELPGIPSVNACGVASTEIGTGSLGCFGQKWGVRSIPGTSLMQPGSNMRTFQVRPIHGDLYDILNSYYEARKVDVIKTTDARFD